MQAPKFYLKCGLIEFVEPARYDDMGLNYHHLDHRTRAFMVTEIDRDIELGSLFLSDNLNAKGRVDYPDLIRAAARDGDDVTLAEQIAGRLNTHEKPRRLKSGGFSSLLSCVLMHMRCWQKENSIVSISVPSA
jgi:hypothetical protein